MKIKSLILAPLILASSFVAAKINFTKQQLETDFKITHPVEFANLFGEADKQLVVFGENEKNQRILAIYRINGESGEYQQINKVEIPDSFLAYDVLQNGVKQKLIFQSNQALSLFDLEKNQFVEFRPISSIYLRPKAQFLVKKDFIQDINGDDLEDIVIPDFKSVNLLLQNSEGDFVEQNLPIAPKIQMDNDSSTFTETPLFFSDLNQDQKKDLIVIRNKGLKVFTQNGNGTFVENAHDLSLPVEVSALNWWEIRESDGQQIDQNKLSHRTVHKIEDINDDNIADLLVRFSQSEGVLDRQNNYEIYLGKLVEGELTYSAKPENTITADGTIGELKVVDVDGDKRSEIMVSSFDIGVSQIIGALLSGSIDQDVYIFKMDEQDRFSEDPQVDKEVELSFSLSSGKSGQPVVKLADFDGDGLKDLMFSSGEKRLKVFQGNTKKRMFKRRSSKIKVNVPKDGQLVDTLDINDDGKEDVVIRYGRQDDKELSNKLVLLISK